MGFKDRVSRGIAGLNKGLNNGTGSLNKYLYGTQKGRYYLLGGASGTGKTTIMDYMFLFTPYRYMQEYMGTSNELSVKWTYLSFEQSADTKVDSWASKYIFDRYGHRLPAAYLLGKTNRGITAEHHRWCHEADDYISDMLKHVELIDTALTPSQFKAKLIRYGSIHGKWVTEPQLDAEGKQMLNKDGKKLSNIVGWIPNNPNTTHIFTMDHIAYATMEKKDLKLNIDDISATIVFFREKTKWTFVVVQQFNTELASIDRQKYKKEALAPQMVDFADSRYTFRDADVVIGLLNPRKYDLPEYMGYDISKLQGYAIWAFLMKNRHDGPADKCVPFFMDPVAGQFSELPEPMSGDLAEFTGESDPVVPYYQLAQDFKDAINYFQ